jgi:hypothetical protein
MPRVGFKPTIPAFERAKTVHALYPAATVIGYTDTIEYARKWGHLHNNNLYKIKTKIDTNVSVFVFIIIYYI